MKRLFFSATLFAIIFCCLTKGFAEESQFSASVDKQSVRINEEVHLNVRIIGVRDSLQAPRLPSLENFEIFYSGRSSRFSFINGRSESKTEFNYVLIPRSAGQFVLQPIEVKIGDKSYHTNQLEINVEGDQALRSQTTRRVSPILPSRQSQNPPGSMTSQGRSVPQKATPTSTSVSNDELDQNIFLRVTPTQLTVYTNQQLVLTYSLYTRYDTRYEGFVEEPETSGFWIEEFPIDQNLGRETETVDGKKFVRADVKKIALFPTAPGSYQIKPGVVKTSVQIEQENTSMLDEFFNDSFFNGGGLFARRVEKRLAPSPLQIQVKALPDGGKPDSFKGAVGDFKMATASDKHVVNQNEAVTLQIMLEGEGNIETLVHPDIPEIKNTKTYDADTQTQLFKVQNVIAGKKSFEVVIIPSDAGEMIIPSVEFSFFNPKIERYVILKSDSYKVRVNPSKTQAPLVPKGVAQGELGETKKSIRLESEDIQYIKERIITTKQPLLPQLVFGLAGIDAFLTFVCIGLGIMRKRNEYLDRNISLKRTLYAKKYAGHGLKRLDHLARSSSDSKSDEVFFEESAKILNQYLSDKLNLSPQGLTQDMVARYLEARRTDPVVVQKIRECYEICDQVRFGKMGVYGINREAMIKQIREIIYTLERQ